MNFKENESPEKLRGSYYTPHDIAIFLTKWVVQHQQPHHLLEPSIGDGVFLDALHQLDSSKVQTVTGFEIDHDEAAKTRQKSQLHPNIEMTIHDRDFLYWALLHLQQPQFDGVIGNPPFVRYQYLNHESQGCAEKIFRFFNLPFTKHTNLWVPFIMASVALLRPGGRLAMVVPSEILHVMHAQSLRTYLASQCRKLIIIDPEEIWFTNTLQGAVLLLAEKKEKPQENFLGLSIIRTQGKQFLNEDPQTFFHQAIFINGKTITGKWLRALLTQHELDLLDDVAHRQSVHKFNDIANVDVGIVTGANKFFLVPDSTIREYQLQKWAHPMFGRSEHCPGVIYDRHQHQSNKEKGLPANFLWFEEEVLDKYSPQVREYLSFGEQQQLHRRYKCRIRTPWYKVPSVYATNVGLLKRCHHIPRLLYNELQAYTTDTAYRISTFNGLPPDTFVYCFVNSLTALSAELEGRHYGGGVLELVPSEIERLYVPLPEDAQCEIQALDRAFTQNTPADIILSQQDSVLLGKLGLSTQQQLDLHIAWNKLRKRRQRKA